MPRRSELTGVANALAGSFASRNNDFNGYWAMGQIYRWARDGGSLQISVHLVPHSADQGEELTASVAGAYREFLRMHLVKQHLPESWIASCSVNIQFESTTAMPEFLGKHAECRPFCCQILLVDDLAHEHKASSNGWCWAHDPTRETQRVRA